MFFFFEKKFHLLMPPWAAEMILLTVLLIKEALSVSFCFLTSKFSTATLRKNPIRQNPDPTPVPAEMPPQSSPVFDLPEPVLESILGRLSPEGLCNMSCGCVSMRERCMNDFLWERHMNEKWGRLIGKAATKEWQLYIASRTANSPPPATTTAMTATSAVANNWVGFLSRVWFASNLGGGHGGGNSSQTRLRGTLPVNSIMYWYLTLETGRFWFPAQIFNRENGHVGFMLSCYDAELSYDRTTNTFRARYPPQGRRTTVIEEAIQWDRLRMPPLDTPADSLHVSDCLSELRPNDNIEIQWRRNKDFPYGWWYGVVGHLETCDGNEFHCQCGSSETVMLEFNQYTPGSQWRRASVDRKNHCEEGNETHGFYGGIRRLQDKEEISKWRRIWPKETLE